MSGVATAIVVGGIAGAYISSNAQSSAAKKASQSAYSSAVYQADITKSMYDQNRADLLPFIQAGQAALPDLKNVDPTGGAQQYLDNLNALTFPEGVDPTGGMQQYIDQLDQLEFQLDENDPVYQWRAKENERQVNQFFASRGGYDSRAAANMLLSSGMELQAQETERQFNQRYLAKYNQLTDLAKLSYEKGMAEYGAAKDKYSADVAKQTTGFNAALTLGGNKQNQLLNLVKVGTGAASTAGAYGQNTSNQLANIWGDYSTANQNAILQQGAAQGQLGASVAQAPANALLMYQLMK